MITEQKSDLERFHQFVGELLGNGCAGRSPEDVLDEWRALNPTEEEFAEGVAAIREALADIETGEVGRPIEEVLADLRRKYAPSDNG